MSGFARVSVVIPAFNAARYLSAAIGSVFAQTIPVAEIVVVDDGSQDATASVASSFPGVRVVAQRHRGIAATRNRGIEAASGDWIAFLDADDLWFPDKLERQVALANTSPSTTLVFGWVRSFVSPELSLGTRAKYAIDPQPSRGLHASTTLVRRKGILEVGAFDESLAAGEFVEWAARTRDRGLVTAMVEAEVALRRIHGANTVLTSRDALGPSYLNVVRDRLKRTSGI